MQIIGLHRNIYKLYHYTRTSELIEEREKIHSQILHNWDFLKTKGLKDKEIQNITGMSRSTYYRKRKALSLYGIQGLKRRSRKPKCIRQSQIPQPTKDLILNLRRNNPTYGKAKITVILKRDHGISLSESSVGRILKQFMVQGTIQRYQAVTKQCRKRTFKGHAQRWRYGMKAIRPGEMIQIDHMSVSVHPGFSVKHFQAWDPLTKSLIADVYSKADSATAAKFLEHVLIQLPFKVKSIQVDGGSEFMKDFEKACYDKGLELYVLPPKSPKYNGGVERANRTCREDFYAFKNLLPESLPSLRKALYQYIHKFNTFRPHQHLNGLTPFQYYSSILEASPVSYVMN